MREERTIGEVGDERGELRGRNRLVHFRFRWATTRERERERGGVASLEGLMKCIVQ